MEPDQIDKTRTIYDAGAGEIFFKNFLAGFGRAIGSIFIYLIFIGLMGYYTMRFVYPKFEPLITQYMEVMQSVQKLNNAAPTTQYQDLINQFKQINK